MKNERDFASRLRSLREAAGLCVNALAKKAGLTRHCVGRLEKGEREPSLETARKLAAALGRRLECWD